MCRIHYCVSYSYFSLYPCLLVPVSLTHLPPLNPNLPGAGTEAENSRWDTFSKSLLHG